MVEASASGRRTIDDLLREARARLERLTPHQAMEAVAAARRGLPPGGAVPEDFRHFWGSELFYARADPGQDPRHVGTLEPVWNLFDLTREGRPTDWDEQLSYE